MNVYVPTTVRSSPGPRRIRTRRSLSLRPLVWIGGVVACAMVLLTALLIGASFMSPDTVAQPAPTPERDPFHQQKLDAVAQELPAQF